MIITDVSPQKNNDKRYNIYIDDVYSFSADYDDVYQYSIKAGIFLNQEDLKILISKCQYRKALDKALRLLSVRIRSEHELREKLTGLKYDNDIIDSVLLRLKELNYINDMEFSKQWIQERKSLKLLGEKKIMAELKKKGISSEVIDDSIKQSGCDDMDAALALIEKKLRMKKFDPEDRKFSQKIYRYLLYRGISYETACKALNKYVSTIDLDS